MATYNIDNVPSIFANGDIINCPYSGGEKTLTLSQRCLVKLECWGGKGGDAYNLSQGNQYGDIGGYTKGNMILNGTFTLYLNCGGKGIKAEGDIHETISYPGGYNGGGDGYHTELAGFYGNYGSGGGATHIALSSGVLSSLDSHRESVLAVAGGGGAACVQGILYRGKGYKGGGLSGEGGQDTYSGKGGTQTAGGDANASFGQGSTGAGGGWYGGGSGGLGRDCGAGGGSGYINPSLLNAQTTIEETSSNPDTTQNGYIRITVLDVFGVNIERKYSDKLYHDSSHCFLKKNSGWHEIENVFYKTGGQWKPNR